MKKRNFKAYFSAIVGVAVAMWCGIVSNAQANAVGQDFVVKIGLTTIWLAKMTIPFIIAFVITFIAMYVWQKVHHRSFMSARTKFFNKWDKVMSWFDSLLDD